jgi:hypothetical protein
VAAALLFDAVAVFVFEAVCDVAAGAGSDLFSAIVEFELEAELAFASPAVAVIGTSL